MTANLRKRESQPPITQIIYLRIPEDRDLGDASSYHGKLWSSALDVIEESESFQRLYWGRSLEQPENVQLHVVRPTQEDHINFTRTAGKTKLRPLLQTLSSTGSTNPILAVRYVELVELTPNCQALGKGAPFTGSAIYLRPTAAWHEGAWPLWTHIVRYVDGCMGCAGGMITEAVELLGEPVLVGSGGQSGVGRALSATPAVKGQKWEGYLVYVGWESVEKHEEYHHTKHFAQHRVILRCGNDGYAEYGHVCFQGSREATRMKEKI